VCFKTLSLARCIQTLLSTTEVASKQVLSTSFSRKAPARPEMGSLLSPAGFSNEQDTSVNPRCLDTSFSREIPVELHYLLNLRTANNKTGYGRSTEFHKAAKAAIFLCAHCRYGPPMSSTRLLNLKVHQEGCIVSKHFKGINKLTVSLSELLRADDGHVRLGGCVHLLQDLLRESLCNHKRKAQSATRLTASPNPASEGGYLHFFERRLSTSPCSSRCCLLSFAAVSQLVLSVYSHVCFHFSLKCMLSESEKDFTSPLQSPIGSNSN
jgi:hypothetical protein